MFAPVNSVAVLLNASRAATRSDTTPIIVADAGAGGLGPASWSGSQACSPKSPSFTRTHMSASRLGIQVRTVSVKCPARLCTGGAEQSAFLPRPQRETSDTAKKPPTDYRASFRPYQALQVELSTVRSALSRRSYDGTTSPRNSAAFRRANSAKVVGRMANAIC